MKIISISLVTMAIMTVGGYYLFSNASKEEKQALSIDDSHTKVNPVKHTLVHTVEHKDSDSNTNDVLAKPQQKPVYNIRETVYLDDVYEPVSIAEMKTKLKTKPKVEPIGAFTMPKGTIRKLFYGDSILLPDINGHDYELKIVKSTIGKSGSVILEASVGGDDSMVKSVLTEGERTSYITLSTAEGVYELESIDGNGFVYSSSDIKNQLIDYTKSDAVKPPEAIHQ